MSYTAGMGTESSPRQKDSPRQDLKYDAVYCMMDTMRTHVIEG